MDLSKFIDKKISGLKTSLGIRDVTDFIDIDKQKRGFVNTQFQIQYERYQNQDFLRMRTVEYSGSGTNGRSRKSFAWPFNAEDPSEFIDALKRIAAAAEPTAEQVDPRGGIARFFDRLTGLTHINTIDPLDTHAIKIPTTLSATIREDKWGRYVLLTEKRKGRAPIWLLIPFPSLKALIAFLEC